MCKQYINKSVKDHLIEIGFKESYNGDYLEKELNENESLALRKYIGWEEPLFCGKKMSIRMIKNNTTDAYIPKYIVCQEEKKGVIISDYSDVEQFKKEVLGM